MTRDVWQTALHPDVSGIAVDALLFHEAGCRLVHKYCVCQDPFPHPALRGGGGTSSAVVVCGPGHGHRPAHTVTHIRSCVGSIPGQVPEECFPGGASSRGLTSPRRVSFASNITVLGGAPPLDKSPDIILHDPLCPEIVDEDEIDTVGAMTNITTPIVRPPPGFRQFSWLREEWSGGVEPSLFDYATELPGWFPWRYGDQPVDPPSLPVSPILQSSVDDSVIANVGSSREESITPSETVIDTQPVGDALLVKTDPMALLDLLSFDVVGMFSKYSMGQVADSPRGMTNLGSRHSPGRVPRWRLAREGPFLAEKSSSSLRLFGAGCALRNTTYRASVYASPSGEFGIPLNHPRFLEWVGVPESAGLLEMGPGRWLNMLSRDQAMNAAIQLHRDVCMMATNLDVSICPLAAGHGVEDDDGGPRFQ